MRLVCGCVGDCRRDDVVTLSDVIEFRDINDSVGIVAIPWRALVTPHASARSFSSLRFFVVLRLISSAFELLGMVSILGIHF